MRAHNVDLLSKAKTSFGEEVSDEHLLLTSRDALESNAGFASSMKRVIMRKSSTTETT